MAYTFLSGSGVKASPVDPGFLAVEKGHAFPAATHKIIIIVQANQIPLALSGGDDHLAAVIGIAMIVVIGIVFGKVPKILKSHVIRVRKGGPGVFQQHHIHIGTGDLVIAAVRFRSAVEGIQQELFLAVGHDGTGTALGRDGRAAVKELEKVNLRDAFIFRGKKLVLDIQVLAVEKLRIEPVQFFLSQRY